MMELEDPLLSPNQPNQLNNQNNNNNNLNNNSYFNNITKTKKTKLKLTKQPHLFKSNSLLLQELKNQNNPKTESLMLSLIRTLSLQLSQLEIQNQNNQRDIEALKSLLINSYSVGQGEIERCLVRSRVSNNHNHIKHQNSPCQIQLLDNSDPDPDPNPDPMFYQNTSNHSLISPSLQPNSSSSTSTPLDLDDLREAMSDNSYFDPSSSRSQSQLTTPAAHHHHLTTTITNNISELDSPMPNNNNNNNSEIKKVYPSMSKLLNGPLNGKFRKSAPVPPSLPSSSSSIIHPNRSSTDHMLPTSPSPTPHKRNASIGSNLSNISSQYAQLGTRQPNNVWAFYGWKWNKKNKTISNLSPSLSGETDNIDQRVDDQCEYLENQNNDDNTTPTNVKLDPNHPTSNNSQTTQSISSEHIHQRVPADPNNATILGGIFDSFTRRKRAESSKSALPKSSLQSFTASRSTIGYGDEPSKLGSPASMNVSSSLVTNRSSSLLLDSSCSINTQTTSNSSSFSVDDLIGQRQAGLEDDPQQQQQQACLTLTLPSLDSANPPPSNYSPSESALSSAANSVLPSTHHPGSDTTPLAGVDRLLFNDHDGLHSSTPNGPTPSLLTQPNPSSSTTSSNPPSIHRRPSLGQLKSLPDSFATNSKGLPTLATYSDTIVQTDKVQPALLPTSVLAGFPASSSKIESIAENSDGEFNTMSSHVSSSSLSLCSSVTGPVASTSQAHDRTTSRLRSQLSHQNLSLRSSKSSMIASTSQIKSKPQVKLTQPATTKSYLSTATGTIGKALGGGTHLAASSTELEPNVTTLPNAAFGRLASVYLANPDSRSGVEASKLSGKLPLASIFPSNQTHHDRSDSDPSSSKSPLVTSMPTEMLHHRGVDKLSLKFLPPLSNSTMELSTFTNPQSNPPPFSNFTGDEDTRGFGILNGISSSGASDDEPIIDRFGFIVDAKYGMKLMQKSRDKKKRLAKERLAAMDEPTASVPPQPSTSASDSTKLEETVDSTVLNASSSDSINSPSSALMSLSRPGENSSSKVNSSRCDASLESSDLEQTPMMTTALPIKSQLDVEAELTSLRESLGLSAPNKPNDDSQAGANSSSDSPSSPSQNVPPEPVVESTTQSIRRLLFQLNEMQNMLEKKQMEAWGQFIIKRRLKLMKASNSTSLHNVVSPPGDLSGKSTTIQGTGAVSPASVGAFLGTIGHAQSNASNSIAPSLTSRMHSNPETSSHSQPDSNHHKNPMGGHHHQDNQDNCTRDLITCHDDNLIGIASMGLSNDNNKKALKEEWKEFKKLVLDGIPIALRPKIWLECSGASQIKEPGYYHDLLNLHRGEKGLCLNQIECDVTRTLPTNVYFGGEGPGVGKLRRVLAAMSWHNPLVGYCQGMNMVAATLLLTIPSEEDAFWILVCIVDKILPTHYYTSHLLTSQADQRVLKELVSLHLPQLSSHFDLLDVELPAITFGWFLSLFADALPIQTLLRVFDIFLIDGSIILFRISLALLKINQEKILSHDSPASLYAYMRGPMTLTSHHADQLINVANLEFKSVKNKHVTGLRDKFVAQLKLEMGL